MNYALIVKQSGSGRKYESSAEETSVVANTIKEYCKRDLKENYALKTEQYSELCTIRKDCIVLFDRACLLKE